MDDKIGLTVTVAVVTSDIRKGYASRCINSIKTHTKNTELIILDNGRKKNFSHPAEINRIIEMSETDLLVLMDDDVFVEPGWLSGLTECIDEKTAVVTPVHKDKNGNISYSGCYISHEIKLGEHLLDLPSKPRYTQTYCSALMLMDLRKIKSILMNTDYKKYFFDHVHGLEVWERGYKAVCTPKTIITHIAGATMTRFSPSIRDLYDNDFKLFENDWISSGRLEKLEKGIWQETGCFTDLLDIPKRIDNFFAEPFSKDRDIFKELKDLFQQSKDYNLLKNYLAIKISEFAAHPDRKNDEKISRICEKTRKDLLSVIPLQGGSPTGALEKAVIRLLIMLYGPDRYIEIRKNTGEKIRSIARLSSRKPPMQG